MEYLTYYYRYTILHWLWYNHTRRHLPLLSPWQYLKVAKFLSVVNKAPSMRLIYVVSLSHPTLLYHKDHTYMKGSAWFETFTAIFMFLHISIANCLQNYRKKTKQQNFYRKMFRKKLCEGTQLGRRRSITWLATLDFGECFHILSLFSTPSTFDAQNINTW